MVRLFFLSVMILLLTGCAATTAQEIQPTAPPTVQAHATEPAASPTADATPMATSAAPTATSSADPTASAERAAFADAWQQANRGEAEATALLYFGPFDEIASAPMALWSVRLDSTEPPQLVGDSPLLASTVVDAALSTDEQWIAYSTPLGDWPNELRIARVDGTDERVIDTLTSHTDCFPIFAWLQGSPTLIYNAGTMGFWAYDTTTGSNRLVIPYEQAGGLVGRDSQDRIVMAVRHQPQQARDLVAADPLTGEQEVLGQLPQPTTETLFCRKLSPDGRYLLFGMGQSAYQPYLFDRMTGQSEEIGIVPDQAFWAQDSQHVLTVSDDPAHTIRVYALPDMSVVARAVLPPVGNDGVPSGVRGVSPDGQWLVGCFGNSYNQQSWLYHTPTQTWQQLSNSGPCIQVIGWNIQ